MSDKVHVFGCMGCGSAIAEAFLTLAGVSYDREEVNYDESSPARDRLLKHNPLCQVPTLVMRDGQIMTETLALAHYLNQTEPSFDLFPKDIQLLPKFLRWSTFMVTALYPTWTYGDFPSKWLPGVAEASKLKDSTNEHRKKLWLIVENEAAAPFFMGDRFSIIDVYIKVMVHWRPRQAWFKENCPKLFAIHEKVSSDPRLRKVWTDNFSE
ncbi:MAG: glutathione S-transferase family protein [Bdellovibrionota bacterium]